ncbi:MAG: 4-hydroxyphenylacetate 3-hydroxylase N-terminal domain-containing protein, partial [Pirellulaceae bacterium]
LYDALHDPQYKDVLTVETDTGSGGYTHRYFQVPRSQMALEKGRDAIAAWQRFGYGWLGRSPDYKAGFLATLGGDPDLYAPYSDNARRWYKAAQERVFYLNHAIVHPPIDRDLPADQISDVMVHVVKETDAGVILSGAKVVATGSALTHHNFIAHYGLPFKDKRFAVVCAVDMTAPGVKLICRNSYEYQAAVTGSPFDYPLSSRLDENDAILVLDNVLVPWEDLFIYGDIDKVIRFTQDSGFFPRYLLHGLTRLCVKLDFITGLTAKALRACGTSEFRGVQAALGEIAVWRNLFWALSDAMVRSPTPWVGDGVLPNLQHGMAYRMLGPVAYPRIKDIIQNTVASGLIYMNSNAVDFKCPEIRPYIDRFIRGSHGMGSLDRMKIMKLLWDATGSEFGGRHELYERNYGGTAEAIRVESLMMLEESGQIRSMEDLVERCMSEYDLDGWTTPRFVNPSDVSAVGANNL